MNDTTPSEPRSSPTLEVVVFQHGHEIARELSESAEEASLLVDWWSEQKGAQCRVDDLSIHHRPDDILEPFADDLVGDDDSGHDTR